MMSKTQNAFARKEVPWYDFGPVLSRNALYNFICGARGTGKTYGAKRRAIRSAIHKGEQFIYVRRYHDEVKLAKEAFFADIHHEFPGYVFRVVGYTAEFKKSTAKKWQTMGYFVALSKAQQLKSVSYAQVTSIIFDEFIIERGAIHYIADEANRFNDFYSTVDRYQERVRVFFLSNTVSIMNPYFLQYNIQVESETEWIIKGEGFLCVHLPNDEAFKQEVMKTRFGRFIAGTDYAKYAVDSHFLDNNPALIARKTPTAAYYATIETVSGTFSVWVDRPGNDPVYYVQEKRPRVENIYTMIPEKMDEGKTLLHFSDRMGQRLRAAFKNGIMYFSTPTARNAFAGIFKR